MPELPEVETIKNVLIPIVKDKTINAIEVLRDCTILGDKIVFISSLVGERFLNVTRYGKYLFFHLTNNKVIISHLRMEGKYYEVLESEKNTYYSRVVFHLDNGQKLCYDDSRCFGIMKLSNEVNYLKEPEISKLGPEPFDIENVEYLIKACKKSSLPIKTTITDQSLIAGIGNIYADEILFDCKIHPLTQSKLISEDQWKKIISSAQIILKEAIASGGSTIKSYHPGKDIDGNFQVNLKVYGKYGEKCPICGTHYRFIKVGGRGTTFCPNCQQRLGNPIKVALLGKVASGKSTVSSIFKELGAVTFNCDDEINRLYSEKTVINDINKMFNLDFIESIDKRVLREYLLTNPKEIKRLQDYIFPLVVNNVKKAIKDTQKGIFVCEAPLLFEAKMDDLFDEIIAIDISEENQINRLHLRNPDSDKALKKLNDKNISFEKIMKKANIILNNNADLGTLRKEVKNLFSKFLTRLS